MQPGDHQQYRDFSTSALINDPFFQDWVLYPDEKSDNFWREQTKQYPQKQQIIEEAKALLLSIRFADHNPTAEQVADSLNRSLILIDEGVDRQAVQPGWIRKMLEWRKVAAFLVCALLLWTAHYVYRQYYAEHIDYTAYGNQKHIYLPDSSEIVLNGNSTLRYKRNWTPGVKREVWLEGEAFFDIRHVAGQKGSAQFGKFLVHTEYLYVEVVGTAFDIRKRRGSTEVVLLRGKINVYFSEGPFKEIRMEPGDMVRYDSADQKIYRSTVIPENYSSWKDKKLVLTNAPLSEIIQYIEDNYGKKVLLRDRTMASRTIGGEVDMSSLQDILFILSKTLDIEIVDKGDTLLFKSK